MIDRSALVNDLQRLLKKLEADLRARAEQVADIDLYQDLSESARKRYALLQTPVFVEEFILERTLDPAIESFGLAKVRMIDPTCGLG